MNTSGEAADQVVRMSLEVGEAALKISGTGAKHLAVMLYAVLKEKKKTKGRARLETLVKSGRPLTVFSVKESDLKQFVQEAKRYGVLYCAVRNPKGSSDGLVDVIVKEEEAFVSEQRAYCQGYVDCIQLLAGLGLLKKSTDMEKIISEMKSN